MQIAFQNLFFKTDSIPKAYEDALTKAWSNNSILNQISEQIQALGTPVQKTATCLTCLIAATESLSSEDDAEEQNDSGEDIALVLGF